jgi:hypothetical protein
MPGVFIRSGETPLDWKVTTEDGIEVPMVQGIDFQANVGEVAHAVIHTVLPKVDAYVPSAEIHQTCPYCGCVDLHQEEETDG